MLKPPINAHFNVSSRASGQNFCQSINLRPKKKYVCLLFDENFKQGR